MRTELLQCARCGGEFARRHHVGRRPTYCMRTCRQRAYEARRRAAYHHRLPTPPPPAPHRPDACLYEAGRLRWVRHALRPDVQANAMGRRPTLCGTHVTTSSAVRFGNPRPPIGRDCRTCSGIARRYPLERPIDPPPDLAAFKQQILACQGPYSVGDDVELRRRVGRLLSLSTATPRASYS